MGEVAFTEFAGNVTLGRGDDFVTDEDDGDVAGTVGAGLVVGGKFMDGVEDGSVKVGVPDDGVIVFDVVNEVAGEETGDETGDDDVEKVNEPDGVVGDCVAGAGAGEEIVGNGVEGVIVPEVIGDTDGVAAGWGLAGVLGATALEIAAPI